MLHYTIKHLSGLRAHKNDEKAISPDKYVLLPSITQRITTSELRVFRSTMSFHRKVLLAMALI